MSNSAYPYAPLSVIKSSGRYSLIGGPFGSKLGRKDYVDEGVPVVRGANLPDTERFSEQSWVYVSEKKADELRANLAFPGDIVVTQRGTIGQVGLIPADSPVPRYVLSQSQMKLTVDSELADPRYVYYALASPDAVQRLKDLSFSAGVPHINLGMFASFEIPVPPLPIQVAIADSLSAYDELIENNTRRIKILEEMAQSIYKEWFVNFRYPGHENVPLVDSEFGPIPEGWSVQPLRDTAELAYGKALRAQDRRAGQFPVLGSGGVTGFHDTALVPGPGVVVGRKGNVGSVHWIDVDFYPIDTTFFVRTELSMHYLYYVLRSLDFIDSHAAVPGLSREQAYSLPVLVPDDGILDEFDELVGGMFDLVARLRASSDVLREMRDLLLPRLVSGEIDVAGLDLPGE